jgi:hypothetical protein
VEERKERRNTPGDGEKPRSETYATSGSGRSEVRGTNRKAADAFAGRCKNGVEESRRELRQAELTSAAGRLATGDKMRFHDWHPGDAQSILIMKVVRDSAPPFDQDFLFERSTQGLGNAALDLRLNCVGVHD